MTESSITFIAPKLNGCSFNEAEVLGSIVWLWMQSDAHRGAALYELPRLLMPAIKSRQFVLGVQAGKPVFYLSWANFSPEAEQRYLGSLPDEMNPADWESGDRMWMLDIVAPFGHVKKAMNDLKSGMLSLSCWRCLYHRSERTGCLIKEFKGRSVSKTTAKHWFDERPILSLPDKTRWIQL